MSLLRLHWDALEDGLPDRLLFLLALSVLFTIYTDAFVVGEEGCFELRLVRANVPRVTGD